jgi:hypothetical protein
MKPLLVFMLSLVVLASSLTPCCPADNCSDELTTQASSEQDHEQEGACSPFFACGSCCPGFVQLARQFSVPVPETRPSAHHENLSVHFTSTYYADFFQPPRIG